MSFSITVKNKTDQPYIPISDIEKTPKASIPSWEKKHALIEQEKQKNDIVSLKDAQIALDNIFKSISSQSAGMPLSSVETVSMDSLILMSTNLGIDLFSDSAAASAKAMMIQTDRQTEVRSKQVQDYQDQLAKAIKQADKAKKGGIVQVVFDWTISTAEVAWGAAKVAGAVATGDMVGGASGAAYMLAGMSGMVKAIAETLVLTDVGDKKELEKVIDAASKIQLAMEITASAIDMYQAGKGVMAARTAAASTKTAMVEAAPQIAAQVNGAAAGTISKEAATEASKAIAEEVAQQLSQQIAEQMVQELPKQLAQQMASEMAKTIAQESGQAIIEVSSKEVTEALIKESLKRVIQETIENSAKKAIEKGVEITAEKMAAQVASSVGSELTKSFISMAASKALNAMQGASSGGQRISSAVIQNQVSHLQKQIDKLKLDQDFAQWCYQWYADIKDEQQKHMKEATSKQGDSLAIGSQMISEMGTLQAKIASTTI
jgi:secreted effector protein SseC